MNNVGNAKGSAINCQPNASQPSSSSSNSSSGWGVCTICLDSLKNSQKPVITFACLHKLHKVCAQQLKEHQRGRGMHCPVCRGTIEVLSTTSCNTQPQQSTANYLYTPQGRLAQISRGIAARPFNDDMPPASGSTQRVALKLECLPGITKENLDGSLCSFDGLMKLSAPSQELNTPADFVIVADVSGSMGGSKIAQLKETMHWIIAALDDKNRLSIITFNEHARRKTPLTIMNTAGKAASVAQVAGITAGGGTDITEALQTAKAVLEDRRHQDNASVVILITDGQDTGARERARASIEFIAQKAMLACIGVGADHDPKLLSALSQRAHGIFEYCANSEAIAPAMGGLVGAVTKAAALGVTLILDYANNTKEIEIPLFSAGQEFLTPFTSNMASDPYFKARLAYRHPGTTEMASMSSEYKLEEIKEPAGHARMVLINSQMNREMAAQALTDSVALAEEGDYEGARALLQEAIQIIRQSISAAEPLCVKLLADCESALQNLQDPERYDRGGGVASTLSTAYCHSFQSSAAASAYSTQAMDECSQAATFSVNRAARR